MYGPSAQIGGISQPVASHVSAVVLEYKRLLTARTSRILDKSHKGRCVQNTGVLYSHAKHPAFWTETTMWTNSYTLEQTGEFLRDVRRAKGKRQDVFARELGVSHTTLSNLEQGKNTSTRTLELALQRLGLRLVIVPKSADVSVTEHEG